MAVFNHCNLTAIDTLPSPKEIMEEFPLPLSCKQFIENKRQEIRSILEGRDSRLLLIVGPCSIHDTIAAKDFAIRLKALNAIVSDSFLIVMRTYFEKPRTALGWKGLMYDPFLNGSNDMKTGIKWTRTLLLELAALEIPTATEFLEPSSCYYYGDLISWSCIGARTCSSQIHRQLASGLAMPTAFKNSIDGSLESAINGIQSARTSHTFMGIDIQGVPSVICTQGNDDCHLVLRGGERGPNYDPHCISKALKSLSKANLKKRLLIDCSHDNSYRQHEKQIPVFYSVIQQVIEGNQNIKGLLLESHIHSGNQPLTSLSTPLEYGVSLTDPCLDWETTENLIKQGERLIKKEEEKEQLSFIGEKEEALVYLPRVQGI